MRIPRIYEGTSPLTLNATITLDEYGAGHVSRVLRLKSGNQIRLFDGNGQEFLATLEQVGKKTSATLVEQLQTSVESPLQIELLQVISRGDRMDFTIQKAVELGVTSIVPLLSERCGVKLDEQRGAKKLESYQKIAIAACEQCGRNVVPKIKPLQSLEEFIAEQKTKLGSKVVDSQASSTHNSATVASDNSVTEASTTAAPGPVSLATADQIIPDVDGFINLTLDPRAPYKLTNLPATGKYRILIGPEGGFTAEEVALTNEAQFVGITLGPRILRTETTALVALSILGAHFGDL